jgi:hypothetical protein
MGPPVGQKADLGLEARSVPGKGPAVVLAEHGNPFDLARGRGPSFPETERGSGSRCKKADPGNGEQGEKRAGEPAGNAGWAGALATPFWSCDWSGSNRLHIHHSRPSGSLGSRSLRTLKAAEMRL